MTAPRLLLLSNSTNAGAGFLEHAGDLIWEFLGPDVREVLFVPFAAVRIGWDGFTAKVRDRFEPMGYRVTGLHAAPDPVAAVRSADAVAVGGGNTFHLLRALAHGGLLAPLRERILAGAPYVGWSAGANVACPTIRTTNDMPIVEPPSFRALGLVPFQLNPHYTDARLPAHAGETRGERLLEFVDANPTTPVLALREGSTLRVEGSVLTLLGPHPALVFRRGQEPEDVPPGPVTGLERSGGA